MTWLLEEIGIVSPAFPSFSEIVFLTSDELVTID